MVGDIEELFRVFGGRVLRTVGGGVGEHHEEGGEGGGGFGGGGGALGGRGGSAGAQEPQPLPRDHVGEVVLPDIF